MNIPSHLGDISLLEEDLITFLCSHRVPVGTQEAVEQWIEQLPQEATVLCGNMTGIEQLVLRRLRERGIRVVLVLASAIEEKDYGVPLVISVVADPEIKVATGRSASERNQLMIGLAKRIVVGFMADNGNLARQLLPLKNVTVLHKEGQEQVAETNPARQQSNAEQMGWAIFKQLHSGKLPSLEMRQLLNQYLHLEIEKPSLLHSLILFEVVRNYGSYPDFNFTAFLRLWNPASFRPEDWKSTKHPHTGKWMPSLAERATARLFKALPSKFHSPLNPAETFDPALAHQLIDPSLQRAPKNKRMLQRALNLAYFEHNSANIDKYTTLLGKKKPS